MLNNRPSKEQAIDAVRTILEYIGEDPKREGLIDTPKRVVKSLGELYSGYEADLDDILSTRFFFEVANFQDIILLKDITFKSMCEHHMLPIVGKVDIAYIPNDSVVGISKLARVVEVFARRLQIQEKMTAEIACAIYNRLNPVGVAVRISAAHHCMTMRGILKDNSVMTTIHYEGIYTKDEKYKQNFLSLLLN